MLSQTRKTGLNMQATKLAVLFGKAPQGLPMNLPPVFYFYLFNAGTFFKNVPSCIQGKSGVFVKLISYRTVFRVGV
ncbi:MAG: hypothetical protein FD169_2396 [Bacillota bacterium]|nr:MAG: hypothetical protein FD169_2396 [Bacillota bacterium]